MLKYQTRTSIGVNIVQVRSRNRSTILEMILRNPGICRRDISQATGLAAAAVSDITRELINDGIVHEILNARRPLKPGRNPIGLSIAADAAWMMGVLVDSDRVEVALSDLVGNLVFSKKIELEASAVEMVQNAVIDLINDATDFANNARTTIRGIGVSIPGMTVPETGLVSYSSILGWQDVMLAKRLKKYTDLPLVVDNDVRGMTLARYWFNGRQDEEFLMVYFGDGIACCSLQHGHIWAGHSGAAGQIGHSIIDPNGPLCSCGQFGCFERIISTGGLLELMADEVSKGAPCSASYQDITNGKLTIREICMLIEVGDEAARNAFRKMSRYIGLGLSNLLKIYDPSVLVLAGDMFSFGSFATNVVKRDMHSYFLHQQSSPDIVVDNNSSLRLVGSATLALDKFVYRPFV